MRRLVFVHGGPGLTTAPERQWFASALEAAGMPALFWNEPAPSRPGGSPFSSGNAFSRAVESLAATVEGAAEIIWVAHSCGIHYVLALPSEMLAKTREAILVAPSLALRNSLRKIASLAAADFCNVAPEKSLRIEQLLNRSTKLFDEPMQDAAQLALTDPALLAHYWRDQNAMARFFEVWNEPGAALDPSCFSAVLGELSRVWTDDLRHVPQVNAPATLVLGDCDPTVDPKQAGELATRIFAQVEVRTLEDAGHFPHLEHPESFMQILHRAWRR